MNRHIQLNGAKNFRDFGGYRTRQGSSVKRGLLYRSDSLSTLDGDDLCKLTALGIRTICDLRRPQERESHPSKWSNDDTRFHHLPLFLNNAPGSTGSIMADARRLNSAAESRQIMIKTYRKMVSDDHALLKIRQIFELIASSQGTPLLIQCSGGKDRTGVCSALILTLLGVDRGTVMQDYMASLDLYTNRLDSSAAISPQVHDISSGCSNDISALRPIYAVDPSYLGSAFETISEKFGTIDSFFRTGLSLTEEAINSIKEHLIE